MKMPNFLIIGANKSGTTTLYNYLKQHPEIYLSSLKEPHFFSYGYDERCPIAEISPITNLKDYCALFRQVSNETAIGEASTSYLNHPQAAKRIYSCLPNAKLITILRDPVEGAYSKFLMEYRKQFDISSKQDPLHVFEQAVRTSSSIRMNGLYYKKIQRYLQLFNQKQLKIYLFEDLKNNTESLLQDVFLFLDVDENFHVDKSLDVYNAGGIPKNKTIYNYLEKSRRLSHTIKPFISEALLKQIYNVYANIRNFNFVQPPKLPLEIRKQLIDIYRDDILHLQDLLHRDLSTWLE